MEKELIEILKLWQRKADNDLKSIANELSCDDPVTDVICFHAQQATEKFLKLFLISKNLDPIKTHNIGVLLYKCIEIDESFKSLSSIEYLSDYAVELRYPDSFYIPELEEAKEAYEDALKVRTFVIEKYSELNEKE